MLTCFTAVFIQLTHLPVKGRPKVVRQTLFIVVLRKDVPIKAFIDQLVQHFAFEPRQRCIGIPKNKINRLLLFIHYNLYDGESNRHSVKIQPARRRIYYI